MYSVGEYIVHPGQGVCEVVNVSDSPQAVYELLPVGQRHPVHISFPVASESRLRPVLSRDEAEEIFAEYPTMELEDFHARNNALEEEHFKDELRTGTCRDSVRIAKTFRVRIASLSARNKKPPVSYERILKMARERSDMELAVALGCTTEEVDERFEALMGDDERAS